MNELRHRGCRICTIGDLGISFRVFLFTLNLAPACGRSVAVLSRPSLRSISTWLFLFRLSTLSGSAALIAKSSLSLIRRSSVGTSTAAYSWRGTIIDRLTAQRNRRRFCVLPRHRIRPSSSNNPNNTPKRYEFTFSRSAQISNDKSSSIEEKNLSPYQPQFRAALHQARASQLLITIKRLLDLISLGV